MNVEDLLPKNIDPTITYKSSVPTENDLYTLAADDLDLGSVVRVESNGNTYMLISPVHSDSPRGWSLISTTTSDSMTITSPSSPAYLKDNNWGTSTISAGKISVGDSISDLESEIKMLKENMTRQLNITMLHGCRNCGARIDVDINKPVFYCKYCGTSYVIGTVQMNSTY